MATKAKSSAKYNPRVVYADADLRFAGHHVGVGLFHDGPDVWSDLERLDPLYVARIYTAFRELREAMQAAIETSPSRTVGGNVGW